MKTLTCLCAGIGAVLLGTAAEAEKYAISTFLEPGHIVTTYANNEFSDRVRAATDGEIDFEVFAGGALLPAAGTIDGVASGVAQAGVYAPAYSPSAFPLLSALSDLSALKPDLMVLTFAYADFLFNHPEYDEWQKNGVVYTVGITNPTYHYLCRGEAGTLEQLQGKKVRTSGAGWARFAEGIGMVPVNLPASEIYTGLERGALDCICADVTHLTTGSTIGELVDSIAMIDLQMPYTSAGLVFDKDFWQSLTDDQRRLLLDESARAQVRMHMAYASENNRNLEWAKANGIELIEPDAALQEAFDDWVADGVGGLVEYTRANFGIADPETPFKAMEGYFEKWDGLLAGVDQSDEEALLALVRTELYDKVDPAAYGME